MRITVQQTGVKLRYAHRNKLQRLIAMLFCSMLLACNSNTTKPSDHALICTTTIVADLMEQIAPPTYAIMGPGTDPHLYKSKSGDHQLMNDAITIVYSGLHLEGKLSDALSHLSKRKNVICLSDGIAKDQLIQSGDFASVYDPHFWFDVDLVRIAVINASKKLIQFQPSDSTLIANNLTQYLNQLDSASRSWEILIQGLPLDKRILVTAHDAFGYFGKKYNFTVKGIQGASTAAEAGLKDITELVDFICEKKIKAIFVESSVSERNVKAIVEGCQKKGHKLLIGGTLYSDALGSKEGPAGTYINFMHQNIKTIVNALK